MRRGGGSGDAAVGDGDVGDASPRRRARPWWVELPVLVVVAFVATFLIQTFLFKVFYIPSPSMERTLHGATTGGDRVLVNRVVYDFTDPEPGEVVVFRGPVNWTPEAAIPGPSSWYGRLFEAVGSVVGIAPPNETDFVKRVIATGGQVVRCCDAEGRVTVDDRALDEPYISRDIDFVPGSLDCTTSVTSLRCFGPVTVPADALWVMGDNRADSADSAFGCRGSQPTDGCRGPIAVDDVIGKAIAVVAPVSRWQIVHSRDIQGQ